MTAPSKPLLPLLLSANAGYVDTVGFLALQGLFVAHVTGNFVTLGAALTHGSSGIIAKLLALPVFCMAIVALRLIVRKAQPKPEGALTKILVAQVAFLTAGGGLAIYFGGFANPDGLPLVMTGMLLVVAMALQNAAHRLYLGSSPPSTLMTGTTTQVMIDLADLIFGGPANERAIVRGRFRALGVTVLCFAVGCGAGALSYITLGMWCFALPPVLALVCAGMVASTRATP